MRQCGNNSSADVLDVTHEWLLLGAVEKAHSVLTLTRGYQVSTVLEVGAGTGAVLERLDQARFAEAYHALEPSPEMSAYITRRGAISRLRAVEPSTLQRGALGTQSYDLVILSHVLEHVEDPASLLCRALQIGRLVIVEVPLEGSWAANVRALIKARLTGIPRTNNTAGHILFYSRRDISSLVCWCGGEIVRSRVYVPRAQMRRVLSTGSPVRRAYAGAVLVLSAVLGARLWSAIYHAHCAVMIAPRPSISAEQRSRWASAHYYEPAVAGSVKDGQNTGISLDHPLPDLRRAAQPGPLARGAAPARGRGNDRSSAQ